MMFKLFFRIITLIMFFVFISIGLALWKGGEPFRWVGEGTVIIGKTISGFGDFVDDVVKGSDVLQEAYEQIKKSASSERAEKKDK